MSISNDDLYYSVEIYGIILTQLFVVYLYQELKTLYYKKWIKKKSFFEILENMTIFVRLL